MIRCVSKTGPPTINIHNFTDYDSQRCTINVFVTTLCLKKLDRLIWYTTSPIHNIH